VAEGRDVELQPGDVAPGEHGPVAADVEDEYRFSRQLQFRSPFEELALELAFLGTVDEK